MCNLIFTLCYSRAASLQQSTIGYMCGKFKAAALGKSLFSPVSPTNHIFYPAWLSCFGWGLLCARGSGFVDSGGRVLRRISAPGGRERFNLACLADRKCAAHCIHASVQEHICSPDAHINPLYHVYITDKLSPKCAEPTHNNNSRSTSTSSHPPLLLFVPARESPFKRILNAHLRFSRFPPTLPG